MKKLLAILMSVFVFAQGVCYQSVKAMFGGDKAVSSGFDIGVLQEKVNKGKEILEGCMSNRIFEITRENVNNMCLIVIDGENEYKLSKDKVQFTNRFNLTLNLSEMMLLPLSYVTILGGHDCADALIKIGANVNGQDAKKNTALHYAVCGDKLDIGTVRLLLENGADPFIKNGEGKTACNCANDLMREYIDKFKVYRDSKKEDAKKALDVVCEEIAKEEAKRKAKKTKREKIVRVQSERREESRKEVILEEKKNKEKEGSKDKLEDRYEITEKNVNDEILMSPEESSREFELDKAKVCFRVTSDKIYENCYVHRLPLGYAARAGKYECASILINMGADVNGQDVFGHTALHYAACSGRTEVIKILLDHGARIDIKNKKGNTAIDVAKEGFADFIRKYYQDVVIIQHTRLTPENVNVNISVYKLPSAMDYFQYNGKVSGKRPLYSANDILANSKDQILPLIYAVWCKDLEFVKRLVDMGADVNGKDNDGNTALHYAVIQGNDEIVNFLIEQGADTSVFNNAGKTAWDCIVGY